MLDEKVISRTICYFEEALPRQNTYIIVVSKGQVSPKYVKSVAPSIYIVENGSVEFWKAIGDVNVYSNILIHQMNSVAAQFVNKIQHSSIVWIVWGADLYSVLLRRKGYKLFYNEKTAKSLLSADKSFISRVKSCLFQHYWYWRTLRAINKVTYICAINGDYELLVKYYPKLLRLKRKDFFYYPIDDIIPKALLNVDYLGNDIIVGNSASYYGNHEEVFRQLSTIDIGRRKIKVPLSYGASSVVKYVKEKGQTILGDSFVPILDYMSLEEYNHFLCGARTFIYGNYRQEAMGNIVVALYIGGAVFLHPSNILLREFKDMGCICFSTEELVEKIHYCLTGEEVLNNKRIIQEHFNRQRLLDIIKTEFSTEGGFE